MGEDPKRSTPFQDSVRSLYDADSFESIGHDFIAHRFIKPTLEYTFGPDGTLLGTASRSLQLTPSRERALTTIARGEVAADAFALWVTTLYARRSDIDPRLLWDALVKLFDLVETLEKIQWTTSNCLHRSHHSAQTIVFSASRSLPRARAALQLLRATLVGRDLATRDFVSYWTKDRDVRRRAAGHDVLPFVTSSLDRLVIAHRRALFEAICPEHARKRSGSMRLMDEPPESLKGTSDELRRHQEMPDFFWSETALRGSENEDLDTTFVGAIHAFRRIFEVCWDVDKTEETDGTTYRSLLGEGGVKRALELVRRPRLDMGDEYVQFPPGIEWSPQFLFAQDPLAGLRSRQPEG